MNANDDRLAVLIVETVLAHRRRWHDTQAVNRLLDEAIADAFPGASRAEISGDSRLCARCDPRRAAAADAALRRADRAGLTRFLLVAMRHLPKGEPGE